MRLYLFEHCSLCFRVRMIAALKRLHLQETVVLNDDSDTMISLAGKRVVPILVKNDGQPMLESMDMVDYVDGLGGRVLTGPQRNEVATWADRVFAAMPPLTQSRYPLLGLPEFGTVAALDHYHLRKRKTLGDFVELRANTRQHINLLMPDFEELDRLIEEPLAVNGKLSLDDIRVLPLLRSAAVVKGLRFPRGSRLLRGDDEPHRIHPPSCRMRRTVMKRMHVHVGVEDLDRSIGFYSALFATQPAVVKSDYAKWMLDDPRVNFAISTRGKQPGMDHLGIQVESKAELSEVYGRFDRPAERSSSRGRPPAAMPSPKSPGSTTRRESPGRRSSPAAKAPTTA